MKFVIRPAARCGGFSAILTEHLQPKQLLLVVDNCEFFGLTQRREFWLHSLHIAAD